MSQISENILRRVADFIEQEHLFPDAEPTSTAVAGQSSALARVYVGFSGGPDSVCLLDILQRLGYACEALHCNFHLRDEESDRDELFCRQICLKMDVPLQVKHFDTHAYMRKQHLSLEMAARRLRYQWWDSIPGRIALGHHQDDSIETLLINLMRGTGIHGLTGIVPYNAASRVARPLLCLSRQDILDYLRDNDLSYVIDSTNAHCDTVRNQIRHQLLPLMEQLLPQARQGIASTMRHLQGSTLLADAQLASLDRLTVHHRRWGLQWDELPLQPLRTTLAELLPDAPAELLADTVLHYWKERHCDAASQTVAHDSQRVYTTPLDVDAFEQYRPQLSTSLEAATSLPDSLANPSATSSYFDADKVQMPLTLRRWREGDRIAPLGMQGHHKLVSDLFSNAHFSPMQKATTWLVCDASDAIVWVPGLRMSESHKVTPETTRILTIRLLDPEQKQN